MADRPWIFRTYSGHSNARASNELYRTNLAKGQTGLSVAFDLPTQTGYDPDHALARGEVGKVGVPVGSIEDMAALFDSIPLDQMNTSMTINATAAWLLALYIAVAEQRGIDRKQLQGTTQNDIIKEYLSRGTYIFPPEPSLRLTSDTIEFTVKEVPKCKWNPINVCSYHLQEAGATPVQEVAFSLANAIAVLDSVNVPAELMPQVVGRISFFCNAGLRFVEETCKMRAFVSLWDRITRERYRVEDPKFRRFRYGVQVNSLGLTEEQPENNIRPGTRRSDFPDRGTSSGRSESSKSWRTRPTSSSTGISLTGRPSSRPRPARSRRGHRPRSIASWSWVGRSRRSNPDT
jgi:(2R)-ethylmalonyl-CoA mutase